MNPADRDRMNREAVARILVGHDPEVTGAAIAELFALWVADHHVWIRHKVFDRQVDAVRKLYPAFAAMDGRTSHAVEPENRARDMLPMHPFPRLPPHSVEPGATRAEDAADEPISSAAAIKAPPRLSGVSDVANGKVREPCAAGRQNPARRGTLEAAEINVERGAGPPSHASSTMAGDTTLSRRSLERSGHRTRFSRRTAWTARNHCGVSFGSIRALRSLRDDAVRPHIKQRGY